MANLKETKPHSTHRNYGATYTRNTDTARTGVLKIRTEPGDHKNSNGATTTKRMVIPPKNVAKVMVRHNLNHNMVRAKARRDLMANGIGRARIFQQDIAQTKQHQLSMMNLLLKHQP